MISSVGSHVSLQRIMVCIYPNKTTVSKKILFGLHFGGNRLSATFDLFMYGSFGGKIKRPSICKPTFPFKELSPNPCVLDSIYVLCLILSLPGSDAVHFEFCSVL